MKKTICKKTTLSNNRNSDNPDPVLLDFSRHKAPFCLSADITLWENYSLNNIISTKLSILLH